MIYTTYQKEIRTDDFASEKELANYTKINIKKFTEDILEDELVSFEFEKRIEKKDKTQNLKRIDLYVVGKKSKYIVEFKNPKWSNENLNAIGQILNYGRQFTDPKKELVLISTMFDIETAKTIKHYNLPIRYIYFDKEKSLEYLGDEDE